MILGFQNKRFLTGRDREGDHVGKSFGKVSEARKSRNSKGRRSCSLPGVRLSGKAWSWKGGGKGKEAVDGRF